MPQITLKGHTFSINPITDSFSRRSQYFENKIIESLGLLGIVPDAIEVEYDLIGIKRMPASVSWFMDGHYLHYTYKQAGKCVENLAIISKIISLEVSSVLEGHKQRHEFVGEFSADEDHEQQKKEARILLGVDEKENNLDIIDRKYKDLAKTAHPDMPNGNIDTFKALNKAHKLLRKELL
jgi:hypothetical protein